MAVRFTILASGSSGNCAYLETETTRILIDAGLSGRQIRQRLLTLGRTPEALQGILITHEHSDHIQGLAALARKLRIPVYCNRLTRDAIVAEMGGDLAFQIFETGRRFEIGDVEVDNFSIPHDAQDPVGFLLRTSEGNVGFLTDLGHATRMVIERVKPANILVLEANHDLKLLQDDVRRPWSVKQRIASRHGHLCNSAAASAIEQILHADMQQVYLGHLSRDCNRPELAFQTVHSKLREMQAHPLRVEVACPDLPSACVQLSARVCQVMETTSESRIPPTHCPG